MNQYQLKRELKIERLQEMAAKTAAKATSTYNQARKMSDCIPFGQPILIGHHSEGRDRNFRGRITSKFEKSFELSKKADYYEQRAESAASNTAISSDDPDAPDLLADKIAKLEAKQEKMKLFNKLLKKGDTAAMLKAGFSQAIIDEMTKKNCFGDVGFTSFQLTNNNANIRRLKERLKDMQAKAAIAPAEDKVINGVTIVDNADDNRLQLFFPGKPSEEIRKELKSSGFRWSPNAGAWQRQRSNAATYLANKIIAKLMPAAE